MKQLPKKHNNDPTSKKQVKRAKKELKDKESNGVTKMTNYPSSSQLNSEERSKSHKVQQINSQDEELINNATGSKMSPFREEILARFELQKIDQIILSKDEALLFLVTFLGKKDPTNQCKCICTSSEMQIIELNSSRKYRLEYLEKYLIQCIE